MSDPIGAAARNPFARSVAQQIGVSLPPVLKRGRGPLTATPLSGRSAHVAALTGGAIAIRARHALQQAGADFPTGPKARFDVLVLDATDADTMDAYLRLRDVAQPAVKQLASGAHVVVLGRPRGVGAGDEAEACRAALEAFTRSLAKELGRKGSTANMVRIAEGAEDRFDAPLRWFAGDRSSWVTTQALDVTTATPWDDVDPVDRALAGKTAVVTGAARGIGAATARRLAEEGADVIVLDRPEDLDAAEALAAEIGGTAFGADVRAADTPQRVATMLAELGGADIVIHNAGITKDRTFKRMSDLEWSLVLDINLAGAIRMQRAIEAGALNDGGRVIGLASVVGIAGNPGQAAYASSKAGFIGWAVGAAPRLADRGITVNAIAPGFIETRMTAKIPPMIREGGRRLSALSQGGLPVDVAEAITMLCSPGAAGITGQTLRVCGGALVGA